MKRKQNKDKLDLIEAAIKGFPKILRRKEDVFREKAKILKAFQPVSRELNSRMKKNKKK